MTDLTSFPVTDRFSVCQHVLRLGDLRRDLAGAAAAGCSAISLNRADFGGFGIDEAAAALGGSGLAVSSYIDPALMRLGPAPPDLDAVARGLEDAARLGAPCMLFISGEQGRRPLAEADGVLLDSFGRVAEIARGVGVVPMLEPLHPIAREFSFVHTVGHAAEVARAVGAGIVVDTGASWWERRLLADVLANLDLVQAVQITDVSSEQLDRRRYERAWCTQESAVAVAQIVNGLVAGGYAGWFEHEVLVEAEATERIGLLRTDRDWFAARAG